MLNTHGSMGKVFCVALSGLLLILGMTAASPASATIAYVQGTGLNPNSGSSVSVTFSAAQTAGNFNVVTVAWDDTTSTVTSITDTKGNTYVQAGTSTTISGTVTQQVYYATNIAAATAGTNKVTVVYSKSVTYPEVKIAEYSGISTSSPFDGMASGTGTGTAIITGSLTTTNSNDLLLASDVIYGTSTAGDPNYTSRDTVGGDLEQDRIVSAVGTYTASDTQTPSSWWLIQLVAFKAAAGGSAPTAPTNLANTVVSSSAINLAWTASTGATGYVIQRCAGASCTSFAQVGTATTASYSDTGLAAGTSYSYRVDATNSAGTSGFSNTTTGTTNVALPTAPSNLTNSVISSSQINLTWSASTSGATGYAIQRCQGAGCTSFAQVGTSTTTSYSDTGLTASTSYSYRVDATNTAGASGFSNTTTGTTSAAATAPTTPGTLSATSGSSTQINLTWGASTDAVGVTAYLVGQCSGAGCSTFTQIASVAGTSTSYSNTGLASGTSYSYEVRATDAAGLFSGYSNVATAMTPTGSGVSGSVSYGYDALGRLIQVAAPTVNSVQAMTYDAAGNISSTASTAISTESIEGFSVSHASPGQQITIDGSGFSTTASSNTVTVNGVAATVVSATATQLVITVPASATTGPIKVTVGGVAVTSSQSITIAASAVGPPTITSFSPSVGSASGTLTVTGTNFSTVAGGDKVLINGWPALVTAATSTTLSVTIPESATGGPLQILTPSGSVTSSTNLYLPPAGYAASSIGSTGQMVENGSSDTVSLPTAGLSSLQVFSGQRGDLLTIGATGLTLSSVTLTVYSPDGAELMTGVINSSGQGLQLPALPSTGTYTVLVNPGSNTGNVTLTLVKAFVAALTINGASATVNFIPNAWYATLTFSGTQGSYVSLALSSVTLSASSVTILNPNGSVLIANTTVTTSGVTLQPQLPTTGIYTVIISPNGAVGGSLTASLASTPTPTLPSPSASGSVYSLSITNQSTVALTFQAPSGQYAALNISEAYQGSEISGATITVVQSNGAVLTTGTLTANTCANCGGYAGSTVLNMGPLPSTGTYVIQVTSTGAGTLTMTLSAPAPGALTIGATSIVETSAEGQPFQYTFSGTTGQYLALNISESYQGSDIAGLAITILQPNGTVLTTSSMTASTCANCGGYGGIAVVNMGPLPSSGTYTVVLQQTQGQSSGTLSLSLSAPVSGTLPVGSTTSVATGLPGQPIQYTFAGTSGQYLGLSVSESYQGSDIPSIAITVLQPSGAVLSSGTITFTTCANCGGYGGIGMLNIGPLPSSGTYTVLVQQTQSLNNGTLAFSLSAPVSGTLPIGATTSVATGLPGQPIQYTFAGTAGQYLGLSVSESYQGSDIPSIAITVLQPSGAVLSSGTVTFTTCANCGGYGGIGMLNIGPLPSSGTYTVLVQQTQSLNNGTLAFSLSAPVSGTLSVGATTSVATGFPGQPIQYTFAGTAGQYLALNINEADQGSDIPGLTISVLQPSGTVLATGTMTASNCSGCQGYGGSTLINMGPLPSSGTYTVVMQQTQSFGSGTLAISLSAAVSGTLTVGSSASATTSVVGQPILYTFAGTAGQSLALKVTEAGSYIAGATVSVLLPSGTALATGTFSATYCSGCGGYTGISTLDFGPLSVTETYTILIQQSPPADGGGTLGLVLSTQ